MLLPRRSLLLVPVLALGWSLLVPLAGAQAVTRPETLYDDRPVGAGPVEPGFPVDYVGVTFEVPPGWDAHEHLEDRGPGESLAVRLRTDGQWGPWQTVEEDGAQAEGRWTGALVPGHDAEAYQVRGVPAGVRGAVAAAINTTDGPRIVTGHRPAGTAEAVTPCKSRVDWGADESIRTTNRSYAKAQVLTVHHTATENGDTDPDATVRAIYSYHVKTNGWDDIGYQALISEDGTVYQGRWSGADLPSCASGASTTWDFGHKQRTDGTWEVVTGAHVGGYNTGNFGVSLLGTFDDAVAPQPAARSSLVTYLDELADRHGIDPVGTVQYDNGTNKKTVDAISGHRDFTATLCPGGSLYADLPKVRSDVAAAGADGPQATITAPASTSTFTASELEPGVPVSVPFDGSATVDGAAVTAAWSWSDTNGLLRSTQEAFTATLPAGVHTVTAAATVADGTSASDAITVTVVPVDDVATAETTVHGTRSGDHPMTWAKGAPVEQLVEVESGGKASRRYSLLEHRWTVPVSTSNPVVVADVTASASDDRDGFSFAYSLDGRRWKELFTVQPGATGTYSAALPSGTSGDVLVRVTDTDRTAGNLVPDTLTVDHLHVRAG